MNRQELYNQGKFFIKKREFRGTGKNMFIGDGWAIYRSEKFGSWRLFEKFNTEEECDWEIEQIAANYENCIVE